MSETFRCDTCGDLQAEVERLEMALRECWDMCQGYDVRDPEVMTMEVSEIVERTLGMSRDEQDARRMELSAADDTPE